MVEQRSETIGNYPYPWLKHGEFSLAFSTIAAGW